MFANTLENLETDTYVMLIWNTDLKLHVYESVWKTCWRWRATPVFQKQEYTTVLRGKEMKLKSQVDTWREMLELISILFSFTCCLSYTTLFAHNLAHLIFLMLAVIPHFA